MTNSELIDRSLDPLAQALTPEVAQRLVESTPDEVQSLQCL